MQVSGRLIILSAFGLAIVMSGGAWLYHYSQVRQIAAFWGNPGGRLLVRGEEVTFFELGEIGGEPRSDSDGVIAGRPVERRVELSSKSGLVHLRHAIYQDSNFQWEGRQRASIDAAGDWAYAVRFAEGEQELIVLFSRGFDMVGKLEGGEIDAIPAPRIAEPVQQYLADVGVLGKDGGAKPPATADLRQAAGR